MAAARALTLALAAVLLLGAGVTAAAAAPLSIIEDDASLLRSGPARQAATLDDMQALGADVVRIIVVWKDFAADDAPAWPALHAAVAGARARGLDVLLTLTGPGPTSASRCRPRAGQCDPAPAQFARFVAQVAEREPDVHRWSAWNEPNIPRWLTPQSVVRHGRVVLRSPQLYRALANAMAKALRDAGRGGDQLLVGETAPVLIHPFGPPAQRPTTTLPFVRALLRSGHLAGKGWAHHAYTAGGLQPPDAPSPAAALGPSSLPVLDRELARAARRGITSTRLHIWLDEAGIQTDPPDPLFGVAPDTQAAWNNQFDWITWHDRAIHSVAQYLVRDEPQRSSFQSGLRWLDGRPKPSFAAYQAPIWVTRAAVWGHVRPRGATILEVDRLTARGWHRVAGAQPHTFTLRIQTAPRAAFRFVWRDAAGRVHLSRAARAGRRSR